MPRTAFSFGSRSLIGLGVMMSLAQLFQPGLQIIFRNGMNAAWLAALLGGFFSTLVLLPMAVSLKRLPGGSLVDLAQAAVGRAGAMAVATVLSAIFCFVSGLFVRETSEMAISAVFPHTPQTFATTTLLLGAVYVAWGDGSSVVRLGRLILPALVISVGLIMVGSMGWGEWKYLLPLWGPGLPTLLATTPQNASFFAPAAVLAVLAGDVSDRTSLVRVFVLTPLISGLALAVVKLILSVVFSYPVGLNIAMPLHMAARLVVGGRFFERLEGVWVFMWVLGITVLLGALLHAAAATFSRAFSMERHRTALFPLATVTLTVAFFPPDQATTITWHQESSLWVTAISLLLPALLGVIGLLRLPARPS